MRPNITTALLQCEAKEQYIQGVKNSMHVINCYELYEECGMYECQSVFKTLRALLKQKNIMYPVHPRLE